MRSQSIRNRLPFYDLSLFTLGLLAMISALGSPTAGRAAVTLSVAGLAATSYPGRETSYQVELLNHTDQIRYDGVISITLPTGFSYVPGSALVAGEGWRAVSAEPALKGQTLTWGPYHLPAAGVSAHNPYGIHTLIYCDQTGPTLHLEAAKSLAGSGGYITQLFYSIDARTTSPSDCAVNFVQEAYARNLIPIVRLGGYSQKGIWQAPAPGAKGDYAEVAQGFARFVAGLPRRDTNPLYVQIWNEPDLWIEWSNKPNATQYARFLIAVSRAIRQLGDSRIRVVNGALTPGNQTFLERMLQVPGFKDSFDVWASHCYPYNHPPSYNNHNRSARYGTYTIDCYTQELVLLKRYGRSGVKVMLTETGYELGNNTFGFEGYSRINETNRASYISAAFAKYWLQWPEVVAVTPFELTDLAGQWRKFDWIDSAAPYLPRSQYEAVSALPKPAGVVVPYGYQVTFRVRVDNSVAAGTYYSQLSGSDREGNAVFEPRAVPVRVIAPGSLDSVFLPVILAPPQVRRDGPWYMTQGQETSPGAIAPTAFLQPAALPVAQAMPPTPKAVVPLPAEPKALVLDEPARLAAVLLEDHRLVVIDLAEKQVIQTLVFDNRPQTLAPGPAGRVYVALSDELALVDLRTGRVVARRAEPGQWRGMAWDAVTGRVLAVDAAQDRLLAFRDNLSAPLAAVTLDDQPDQLLLDPAGRHLYLSFPAVPGVAAMDADTLAVTARTLLPGGPVLALALDPTHQRLYGLSALAPTYRGLAAWQLPALESLALVAGSGDFPLRAASALAIRPDGRLLIAEADGLWHVSPDNWRIEGVLPAGGDIPPAGLTVSGSEGAIYSLESAVRQLQVQPWP